MGRTNQIITREIRVGNIEAEQDDVFLRDCFINNRAWE